MVHVEFYDKHGQFHSFDAKKKRKSRSRPLTAYNKLVASVSRRTGLYGPKLMRAASKEYRARSRSRSRSRSKK